MFFSFSISTEREGMYDITLQIQKRLQEASCKEGLCFIMCPHTTAAITINENADPDVQRDMLFGLESVHTN